jgi:hypothetical protein
MKGKCEGKVKGIKGRLKENKGKKGKLKDN